MNTRMKARRELEMDLRRALAGEQFELYYQPLVVLETNAVNGFEALLRWNHPMRGLVSPADFIPIAEETGLIGLRRMGAQSGLRRSCQLAGAHQSRGQPFTCAAQLPQSRQHGHSGAAKSGMPPRKLQLEITETVLLQNTFTTLATLHELRKMGVQIALDDFGTGYSSLSYLRSFPFDKIKIDRSFIQDLSDGAEPLAIVNAVAGLAKCLNMTSTAEGVETQQRWTCCRRSAAPRCKAISSAMPDRPMRSGVSLLKARREKLERPDTARGLKRVARPTKAGAGFRFPPTASAKNQGPLKEKSRPSSRSQQANTLSAEPRSNSVRACWCLHERHRYKDRRLLPRYRHHRIGVCVVVLEMARNQCAGKPVGHAP